MNEKENLQNSLINDFSVPIKQRCSCFFYLFCCFLCCKGSKDNTREYYINKWRKYLSKETDSKKKLNDPFRILTNLWAHKNVIKDLELIRLNPNLISKNKIRNDLEFYIPQICTFLLFGEYEIVEEFLAFLCKACFASFFFAHRIVWFLKSMMNPLNPCNEKIKDILHIIQTIYKSEKDKNHLERLHVAGSKKYMEFFIKNGLTFLFSNADSFNFISSKSIISIGNSSIEKLKKKNSGNKDDLILSGSGLVKLSNEIKEEDKEKFEEEKEILGIKSSIDFFDDNKRVNIKKDESYIQVQNNTSRVTEKSDKKEIKEKDNSNEEEKKKLEEFADLIKKGKIFIHNFSDFEYKKELNKLNLENSNLEHLKTIDISQELNSTSIANNRKIQKENENDYVNNISNVNFLRSTRDKETNFNKLESNNKQDNEEKSKDGNLNNEKISKEIFEERSNHKDFNIEENISRTLNFNNESSKDLQINYLNAQNFFISLFKNYERVSNDELNFYTQHIKHIDSTDINLSSFLSNINFVDNLCNICTILESTSLQNQHKVLLNEINKINKTLPSNTYIPFLKDSIRNYIVCHIPFSEAKIFKTKNRSPYMITLECVRLEEINYLLKDEENSSKSNSISSVSLQKNNFYFDNSSLANSNSNSNEEDNEHIDDNSMLIKFKKFNIYNNKEKTNDPKTSNTTTYKNSNLIKKFKGNDEIEIRNSPSQREKKKNKFSIFSDFFSSNEQKNTSLDYNSFKDSKSINFELTSNVNNNKKSSGYDKTIKSDEKKFSLIENKNASNVNDFEISDNDNKIKNECNSPKEKKRFSSNSYSFTSDGNKIDRQNYILESEINLSKPIAIKNIYNSSNVESIEKGNSGTKSKSSKSKIKDFIKEKFLKDGNPPQNKKKNIYKNLYENLNYSYSDIDSENNSVKNSKFMDVPIEKKDLIFKKIENDLDYETDPEDLRKIDEVIKREVVLHSPKNPLSGKLKETVENIEKIKKKDVINENKSINTNELNKIEHNFNDLNNEKGKKLTKKLKNNKYNNLIEEALDMDMNESNTDEDNFHSDNDSKNISINNLPKKTSFISVNLNEDNINDDSIITKINQNDQLKSINDSVLKKSKRSSIELIKNTLHSNLENNIIEDRRRKSDALNESSFPKFEEIFGEKIENQTQYLKTKSPFGNFETFTLFKVIVKNGEDLRQEQFATQLINEFHQIFKLEKVDCWVNTYEILATGTNAGLIEVVPNSISLDQLKRKAKGITSLRHFFEVYYGPVDSKRFKNSMKNFISSLAGYSLVCYFIQIKDRHNANILIDDEGHLIHIDFGFMLTNAPGKGIKFEKAPFKLTKEFVDVMGGVNSKNFQKFRKLLWKGFVAVVNNYEKILILVEMMYCGHGNKLPCFEKGNDTINELRKRFIPHNNMKTRDYIKLVDSLIEQSIDNWRTKWYDKYQYWVQGIFY